MKRPRFICLYVVVLILATSLAACGGAEAAYAPVDYEYAATMAPGDTGDEYRGEAEEFTDSAVNHDASLPTSGERLVIMNADISIVAMDPAEAMETIATMAETYKGFVVSSNLHQVMGKKGIEVPYATITIRVPADRLKQALNEIELLAVEVLSKNQSGQDVTKEYTDLNSRLSNLEDAAEQLRQIMDEATKTEDVLQVYKELTAVNEQAEVLRGQIKYYEESAAYSAISVTLTQFEEEEPIEPVTVEGWKPLAVLRDAAQALVNFLQGFVNFLIYAFVLFLPILVLIAAPFLIGWWVVRKVRKPKDKKSSKA
jgi:hypothetical protein